MADFSAEEQKKIKIVSEATRAVHRHVVQWVTSFFDIKSNEGTLGSGTLVDVGGRLFVATAAHCIPPQANTRLWFLTEHPRKLMDGLIAASAYKRHPDLDVGYVELPKDVANGYFKTKSGCPLSKIAISEWGSPSSIATLVGAPAARVDQNQEHAGQPAMATRIDVYVSRFTPPDEWPTWPSASRPLDESEDIVLEYPKVARRLDTNTQIETYHPGGMSGGGIWQQNFPSDTIWTAETSRLSGIQSSWDPKQRYLRATQIIHWLKLLWCHEPDLREHLAKEFGAGAFDEL